MKTSQSQLNAVKNYQSKLYANSANSTDEDLKKIREKRRGQVYCSNGKTWAKKYASREELIEYINDLKKIGIEKFGSK